MKNFLRLLRYGLPYVLQILPGVLLLAMVGALGAGDFPPREIRAASVPRPAAA